jgi:hypothetical protein
MASLTTLYVSDDVAPMTRKVERDTRRPRVALMRIAMQAPQLYG